MGGRAGVERKVLPYEASIQLSRKVRTVKQITGPEACAQILRMHTELTQIYTRACKSTFNTTAHTSWGIGVACQLLFARLWSRIRDYFDSLIFYVIGGGLRPHLLRAW